MGFMMVDCARQHFQFKQTKRFTASYLGMSSETLSRMLHQLEEDNIFNGLDSSVPPQPFCQVCDGIMTPKSYTGIRGIHYKYNK